MQSGKKSSIELSYSPYLEVSRIVFNYLKGKFCALFLRSISKYTFRNKSQNLLFNLVKYDSADFQEGL
jgi:hypothetical protein